MARIGGGEGDADDAAAIAAPGFAASGNQTTGEAK